VKVYKCIPLVAATGLLAACGSRGHSESDNQTSSATTVGSDAGPQCGGNGNWSTFGQNICNTRSVSASGNLNKQTVSKLGVKWTFKAAGDISATPAVLGNDVYVPDWGGMLTDINAQTGKAVWSVSIGALIGASDGGAGPNDAPAPIVSRDTPLVMGNTLIFGVNRGAIIGAPAQLAIVAAVNRFTGALLWQTVVDGHPTAHITSSPVLNNGTIYVGVASDEEFFSALPVIAQVPYPCCSFRGSVVALNASTGQVLWKTYTIEDSAYFEADGKTLSGFAGAAVWSAPTIDVNRGSLYVTTGNNYSEPAGGGALPSGDHIESILSLDLGTGAIKWTQRMSEGDVWNLLTFLVNGPASGGPDWDFGTSASLYQASINGVPQDVVGAGQKSGMYWALNPDTGSVRWTTTVGPGGHLGGIHWGTAADAKHIYVGVNDELGTPYTLGGTGSQAGQSVTVGSWAALDPSSGEIQWQVADPAMSVPLNKTSVNGPVSAVNGVMFGGSMDSNGTMFAFDGDTGNVLWSFQSGATVYGGPAIAAGVVYWGNGYPNAQRLLFGTPGGTLYAFQVQ
jgi:polyvinyl alcohol dehydrogenase (cytochrome)